ncbi:hypothetical protein [Thalassobacillus sp. C254]|uniref:hypothetical protein n=1 Tax=Thalassobacillus sp. C254 TaxID=1225341 RepID=UPI0006CF7D4D|nr:hypothetical protein [Thalassobacillus sp. C254]
MSNDVKNSVITDILQIASELVDTKTFFIGSLESDFSVLRVLHTSTNQSCSISQGMVLPLEKSL